MEVRLDGRTALITGGSLGLGKAMAMMFAESGAKVAIVARRQDVLDETKKEIQAATGGTVGAYSCNVLEVPSTSWSTTSAPQNARHSWTSATRTGSTTLR